MKSEIQKHRNGWPKGIGALFLLSFSFRLGCVIYTLSMVCDSPSAPRAPPLVALDPTRTNGKSRHPTPKYTPNQLRGRQLRALPPAPRLASTTDCLCSPCFCLIPILYSHIHRAQQTHTFRFQSSAADMTGHGQAARRLTSIPPNLQGLTQTGMANPAVAWSLTCRARSARRRAGARRGGGRPSHRGCRRGSPRGRRTSCCRPSACG